MKVIRFDNGDMIVVDGDRSLKVRAQNAHPGNKGGQHTNGPPPWWYCDSHGTGEWTRSSLCTSNGFSPAAMRTLLMCGLSLRELVVLLGATS